MQLASKYIHNTFEICEFLKTEPHTSRLWHRSPLSISCQAGAAKNFFSWNKRLFCTCLQMQMYD